MDKIFSAYWFFDLESQLRNLGLDSDDKSFDEIKKNLVQPKKLTPDEFASAVIYVILAGGFSQKTAKKIHSIIMEKMPENPAIEDLLKIFNNKNKINAVHKVWQCRKDFCDGFYNCKSLYDKLNCLQKLPHIGKITANHLARNLGENVVKYDIWIQRLGVLYGGNSRIAQKIDNGKLDTDIKKCCDDMFEHLHQETNLPIGYIDVVLWKACQNKLISMDNNLCKSQSCMSNTLP
ncbi:MAG: hypothetical protein IJL23_03370 [Alphaproteobacteria bacterium]|nr:hypothetical protein [Alphaproteobacteria bacterium]